ncbi:5832_t:CDS:1, partial [Diversispora eburnea]
NSTQDIKSRIDQIWISDNLVDQLFCTDIIPTDLKSHSNNACVMMEIEDNIFKYIRSITNPNEIMNRIEFNFKGTLKKKWKKYNKQIEEIIRENIFVGNDNIEEK